MLQSWGPYFLFFLFLGKCSLNPLAYLHHSNFASLCFIKYFAFFIKISVFKKNLNDVPNMKEMRLYWALEADLVQGTLDL